jgi:acyl-ACP thioesterase
MKYKIESIIESKFVQSDLVIRFPYFVRIFQDAAFEHSNSLGVGVNELLKNNLAWVLYSMYINVNSYPKLDDKIVTTTWCKCKKGITIERDYEVTNMGKSILKATTTWVLFNIKERKAIQIPDDLISMYGPENYDILPGIKNKLPYDRDINYEYNYKFKTRFLDLDSNDHVNNITYIDYVYTSIYRILKVPIFVKTFNIVYKKEITIYNEDVTIELNKNSSEFNFKITDVENLYAYGHLSCSI